MADEIEALLERLEAENAALAAKLCTRQRDRERAEAAPREACEAHRERRAVLQPELGFATEYVEVLKEKALAPTPRRVRWQLVQLLVRATLCFAAGTAGALLHAAGVPDELL